MRKSVKQGVIAAVAALGLSTTAMAADTLTLAGLGGKVQEDLTVFRHGIRTPQMG